MKKLIDFTLEFQNQDLKTKIPSEIHQILMDYKKIEDPFKNFNELKQKWIAKQDWKFKTFFKVENPEEKQHSILLFEGIDTISK